MKADEVDACRAAGPGLVQKKKRISLSAAAGSVYSSAMIAM